MEELCNRIRSPRKKDRLKGAIYLSAYLFVCLFISVYPIILLMLFDIDLRIR